jgi:hypothetical protein
MVPRSVLNSFGQPGERRPLSHRDDHVVDVEALRGSFFIDGDRRGIDGAGEARRMQLQGLDFAIAVHGGDRPPVHQFHPFFEHVVQIFRRSRHLLRIALHRDHGHFHGALPQRFAGAVDGGVSAADDGHASTQLYL